MFCKEWCLVKRTYPGLTVIPLRCKCWSCEECQIRRAHQLVQEALAGKPDTFITLTSVYKPGRCPHMAARALVKAFRRVRIEYVKEHGKGSWPFLAVFEATKNGWPHIHIVARSKWISQKWLSRRMKELIGAHRVYIERIKHKKDVARYVAKYIGKNPHHFEGVKRYWRSLDYLTPSPSTDEEDNNPPEAWEIVKKHWLAYVAETELLGFYSDIGRGQAELIYGHPP